MNRIMTKEKEMIELKSLTIRFGKRYLLRDVTTGILRGELTALIGRNGSGKSTLLRAIAGLGIRYMGEILIDGKDRKTLTPKELAKTLAFVNPSRLRIADMRCREVAAIGRSPYTDWLGRLSGEDSERVDEALRKVGMSEFAERSVNTLSDGEFQRVMIARALAQDTPLILLDEPTSFLDLPNRYGLVRLLSALCKDEGRTILFSTHELEIAKEYSDRIMLVDAPTLINLPPAEMEAEGHIHRLFSI